MFESRMIIQVEKMARSRKNGLGLSKKKHRLLHRCIF